MHLTVFMIALAAAAGMAPLPAAAQTSVVMLGTGTPNPDPERSGPGVAVVVNGSVYLVDAGAGIVRRAEAARRKGVAALTQPALKIVFLTHLHSDHTLGLADLIFTPWVLERASPLEVYGPAGTRAMTEHLVAAYAEDVRIRLDGWQPQNATGGAANAHDIEAGGVIYRDSNVIVNAFAVPHGTVPSAFGYRFRTRDGVVVITGDTQFSEAVVRACNGCDVLVHEVYSDSGFRTRTPEWQRYHGRFHTSATDVAAIASQARPGLLVLYHQLLWGATPEILVAEVRRGYTGRVVSANDLDIYPVGTPR
jgi:ribonuclease BN (tRNA processing enzyme)